MVVSKALRISLVVKRAVSPANGAISDIANHTNLFSPPHAAQWSKSLLAGTLGRCPGFADILHDPTGLVGDELISWAEKFRRMGTSTAKS